MEEHADDAHNLFLVEEVEDLGHMLNDVKLEVSEAIHGEVVVRQDPQGAAHIVSNLAIGEAILLKNGLEDQETSLIDEDLGQLIDLEQIHEAVSVGISGKHLLVVLILKQVVQEIAGIVLAFCETIGLNKHGKDMGCQVSLITALWLGLSHDEVGEDLDAVEMLVLLSSLLKVLKMLDTGPCILNDTIQGANSPKLQLSISIDLLNDCQESFE